MDFLEEPFLSDKTLRHASASMDLTQSEIITVYTVHAFEWVIPAGNPGIQRTL